MKDHELTWEEQTEAEPFTPEVEAAILQINLDRAPSALEQLALAQGDEEAFVYLPDAAAAAFHLERFSDAEAFAKRALALAPSFKKNWNYGNAVHNGHIVLGLLALQTGDQVAAIAELRAAGITPGSPQLNSFGPSMQLAKSLLQIGYVEPVLEYLEQCRLFWKSGGIWLDLWERIIREGRIPNFFGRTLV